MLKWSKMSLKNRFLVFFILVQLLMLGLLFYYFYHNQTEFYMNQLQEDLERASKLILSNQNIDINTKPASSIDQWVKKWGSEIETRITIIKKNGEVIADSRSKPEIMDNHGDRPEIKSVIDGMKQDSAIRYSETLKEKMFYQTLPIQSEGQLIGVIRLSKSLKNINQIIINNIKNYLLFLSVILLITILLAVKFTSSIVNPLSKLTEMASNIAQGDFEQRIKLNNYDNEVGILGQMFNYMAAQLEEKIKEISKEKNRAEAILTSMVDGVIATDINRKIILTNPAAVSLLDINNNKIENKDLITVVRQHQIDNYLKRALAENRILTREIKINSKETILRCNFAPITNEDNKVIGGIIVFTDITELRKLEQMRKDFVGNVSHELRTPLTSIIGYVDTLLESDIKDRKTSQRFLKIIKKEADRLSLLIKDLLKLSRYENNDYILKPSDFYSIIDKTLNIVHKNAQKKQIKIKTEIEDDLPLVLMIPEQIEQALINLVDNSIKYNSANGYVIIRAYSQAERVYIEIEDDGIGIPEPDLERIFERFYRVDKARSRSLGGTGIGLSIVKHIIQGHNSEIEVESEIATGTTFRFYLKKAN